MRQAYDYWQDQPGISRRLASFTHHRAHFRADITHSTHATRRLGTLTNNTSTRAQPSRGTVAGACWLLYLALARLFTSLLQGLLDISIKLLRSTSSIRTLHLRTQVRASQATRTTRRSAIASLLPRFVPCWQLTWPTAILPSRLHAPLVGRNSYNPEHARYFAFDRPERASFQSRLLSWAWSEHHSLI